jgi:hypothetical protein
MRQRILFPWGAVALAIAVLLWVPATVAGQGGGAPNPNQLGNYDVEKAREEARKAAPHSKEAAGAYWDKEVEEKIAAAAKRVYDPTKPLPTNPPRTPWGDPNISGYFVTQTYTPLQRPEKVTKPMYTLEEAILAFKTVATTDAEVDPANVHYDWKEFGMDAWQSPIQPNLRTALIIDPPDGRIPALTPEAQKRQADAQALARKLDPQTSVSTFPGSYTRCTTGNGVIPFINGGGEAGGVGSAGGVTSEMQIFQSPGYVTIIDQSNNDIRIVPLNGGSLPVSIQYWDGVSRGRWDGNTLVIETTNFRDRGSSGFIRGSTETLKVTEKLSYVDENTLRYEYTMDDPKTWTRPWTVESPLPRIEPPLYEFACHEQNYGIINVVMGAQISATARGDLK